MNILVIDSDRVSRRLAALLLARLGCPPPVLIDDAASLPAGDWSLVLVGEHIAAPSLRDALGAHTRLVIKIGRASCRERVCKDVWIPVVAVSLKKKNKN